MGADRVTPELVAKLQKLDAIAKARGQNLAQLALSWLLKDERVTSVLIGASKPEQVADNVGCLKAAPFSADELAAIEKIVA